MTGDLAPLDRDAPLPLYAQLREALLREVHEGGLRPGDRLPTESELRQRYGVSRATIRQALGELEAEGVIRKVQGLGTFVAAPKIRHVPRLAGFAELATGQGFAPSHRVLISATQAAPAEVAAELGLGEGAACRFVRRLFLADGEVVGLAETWLPADALRGHDELLDAERLGAGSLYEALQAEPIGLGLDHAVETISPGVADADSAALLGCEPGAPVLLIRRLTYTAEERPVEATRLVFAADRYEYRVELRR